jgi:DNA-directed RNA polymerase subunit M/transcription elongation factor TFIIS
MTGQIVITCPECKKQLKGPAEMEGKRVRCKACGQVFAAHASAPGKTAPAAKKASSATAAKTKSAPPPPPEDDGKNPYGLTEITLSNRCPQCAALMESDDSIICLNCGYNTQLRHRMTTISTYAHTPLDWTIWLGPGILCALASLTGIGTICFLWLVLPGLAAGAWWGHLSIQIYGSALAAGIAWIAGKFAYKRLVKQPRPPEKFKRGTQGNS